MTSSRLADVTRMAVNEEPRRDDAQPDILLLHYTGMESAEAATDWLCCEQSGVSCHYLIDEDGTIIAMVDEDLRAWHAGQSSWHGEGDVNSASIGIEIQNRGHFKEYADFPATQITGVIALCDDIIKRHDIRPERVLAHSDVAPGRKIDPGEKFPWRLLYEASIGHWVEPQPIIAGDVLQLGDNGGAVTALQMDLRNYGYGITVNGQFDQKCHDVVAAFQRHFRPELVSGIADISTRQTLAQLLLELEDGAIT